MKEALEKNFYLDFMESLTYPQAQNRIKNYCAYQERCHSEVRNKLYSFGLNKSEVEQLISELISEDYLNEERFAIHFAGGKFRMKKWGKNRISNELKRKQVSDYCIAKAIKEIEDPDYRKAFSQLAEKKRLSLKSEKNIFIKKKKIRDFLAAKGYDFTMINEYLSGL